MFHINSRYPTQSTQLQGKRRLLTGLRRNFLLLFTLMFTWSGLSAQGFCFQETPAREAGTAQITQGRVTGTVSFLASDELAGRAIGSPEFDIAAAFVASRFRGAGLAGITEDSFYQELTVDPKRPLKNVVGILPGKDPELAKEAILFSAHLDHLGRKENKGDGIFNGADDNASGVTAVLTLADAFGAMANNKRTLVFIAFSGEESGLLGSKRYVEQPAWPLDKTIAMINVEMIGRPEPGANGKIWMTGWRESNLGVLLNDASLPTGVEIFEHPKFSAMLYRASDNWPLSEKGVVAHSFSAGSLHSDYHQPDDEWDRLDTQHMTRVIRGLFEASLPMSLGSEAPVQAKKPAN
jgi:hypothetical protein